ncbi:MAG TPA: mannosyltransferase family protein [Pirellulales bacterium]|nr:mannosyltransferase family protein [Pirellulales bacterium]
MDSNLSGRTIRAEMSDRAAREMPDRPWTEGALDAAAAGVAYWCCTSVLVVVAVLFGTRLVKLCRVHPSAQTADSLAEACSVWDGEWYRRIAAHGYSYHPTRMSSVAFYPAYPMLAAGIARLTGLRVEWSLLLVSHVSLAAAFTLLAAYTARRWPLRGIGLVDSVLLAFGLFPTTLYYRMAYTESVFLLTALAVMYAIERGWSPALVALLVGWATATRPVGVALLAPLLLYVWQRQSGRLRFVATSVVLLPVACWGLLAYMAYLKTEFDEPLAFVKTQEHWRRCDPPATVGDKVWTLATFKPLREVYRPGSPCHWKRDPPHDFSFFNGTFLNPIYWLFTAAMVALGALNGWLNAKEWSLGALLLLIPYIAGGDVQCMASEMRYSSVVFPMYLVLGQILHRLPASLATLFLAASACLLALYSALFVSWYWFY